MDFLTTVQHWINADNPVALATVTKTWGSAPRRQGAKLAVTPDLAMIGSVSGGCIEGAVIDEALGCLESGTAKLLQFGVADDTAWSVGLTCGGRIHVFVEPLDLTWWALVCENLATHQRTKTITMLDGPLIGQKILFGADNTPLYRTNGLTADHEAELAQLATHAAASGEVEWQQSHVMIDVISPRPHLIVIGGVHVAIPLEAMARVMGFRVSLIDPRSAFATSERFPNVEAISHAYPEEALAQMGLDRDTYLVVLTHDPKIDDPALATALPAHLPYVGVLSSQRTHNKRVARLKDAGLTDDLIDRIYTPIGLDLGGKTPEEIALGIMAEIIAVRNGVRRDT